MAAAIAVIGAVFGEWSGADEGLGHLILIAQGQLQTARVFAAVVVLSAIALALFGPGAGPAALRLVEPARDGRRGMSRLAAARRCRPRPRRGLRREGGEPRRRSERLTLALDFYVNPDHAGIYTALDRGDFDEAGLEVEPRAVGPSAPIRQVAAGHADLAISYEPEVLLAQDQGLPVIAVAALVSRPLTSLISLPEARIAESPTCAERRSRPPASPTRPTTSRRSSSGRG